jgi:hypothetical protein
MIGASHGGWQAKEMGRKRYNRFHSSSGGSVQREGRDNSKNARVEKDIAKRSSLGIADADVFH